eukprot:TRINITY_DN72599_c0_g1_i1.p1 TRINITY_DN72599_c0_g1~~TRINITY_DN72599_c0_g1_i1.p1  ORF type:complete len:585 (-),score=152.97 TRINITY_DN72599_c0_g1_i1:18-1772(-)
MSGLDAADAQGASRAEGVVAEWNAQRGFGFILLSDGRRSYVHVSQCGGEALRVGQAVTAELAQDARNPGKLSARRVERLGPAGGGSSGSSADISGGGLAAVAPASAAALEGQAGADSAVVAAANLGADPTLMKGVVLEWQPSKGYGFVLFSDQRRAYVHTSQCGGEPLAEGEEVVGNVMEDPRNPGKWSALNVRRVAPRAAAAARSEGVVVEWNAVKGFGFVLLGDQRRAYCHASQCGPSGSSGLREGEIVTCDVVADPVNPGKLAAHNVERSSMFLCGNSIRTEGEVLEWNLSKGFGFMSLPDQRRAYVHVSQTGGVALGVGDVVSAVVVEDERNPGKLAAQDVQLAVSAASTAAARLGLGLNGATLPDAIAAVDAAAAALVAAATGAAAFGGVAAAAAEPGALLDEDEGLWHEPWEPKSLQYVQLPQTVAPPAQAQAQTLAAQLQAAAQAAQAAQAQAAAQAQVQAQALQSALIPLQHQHLQGQLLQGVVTEWQPRGFGFIQFVDGPRAYVHASQTGGEALIVGEHVFATLVPDSKNPGKYSAHGVQRRSGLGAATTGAAALAEDQLLAAAAKRPRLGLATS